MPNHIISLIPNKKGWELHIFHNPVGVRVQLDCPCDAEFDAKALAEQHLGQPVEWIQHDPAPGSVLYDWGYPVSFRAAQPELHSFGQKAVIS